MVFWNLQTTGAIICPVSCTGIEPSAFCHSTLQCMNACIPVCMHVRKLHADVYDACTYVCMYVYVCVYMHACTQRFTDQKASIIFLNIDKIVLYDNCGTVIVMYYGRTRVNNFKYTKLNKGLSACIRLPFAWNLQKTYYTMLYTSMYDLARNRQSV